MYMNAPNGIFTEPGSAGALSKRQAQPVHDDYLLFHNHKYQP